MFLNKEEKIEGLIIEDEAKLAAVIIPIVDVDGKPHILFEKRSSNLPDQPGDICFPGGMVEDGESFKEAAIRECCEELLIDAGQIEMLGQSLAFHAPSITIIPYIAKLKEYTYSFSKDEVAEVFTVPLDFFINTAPEKIMVEWGRKLPEDFPFDRIVGGKNYKWRKHKEAVLFYTYNGNNIWGNTAKMIYYSLEKMQWINMRYNKRWH